MGLFNNIFNSFKRGIEVTAKSEYNSRISASNGIDFGVSVDHDTALRMTAVFSAIRIRSENIASLPKSVRLKTDKGYDKATSHPVHKLLHVRPNAYANVFDFWFAINANMDGWGNSYAIIERNSSGDPDALHPIRSSQVIVYLDPKTHKKTYKVIGSEGFDGVYLDYEMCHFKLFTLDGVRGIDPIAYNAYALGKGVAATKFGAEFYKKGGNIKAVLETENSMADKDFTNFMNHFKSSSQNYDTPLLEYGIKYKQVGISPIAAQLLQTETFTIQDIARIFNIPPHMLSELSHATFSNIEHQTIQFLQYSIRPSVKRFETELETKLFFEGESDQYDVKFNLNGMMRGDMKTRAEWFTKGIQNGFYTRNEVREMENLPHLSGLDTPLYPSNLTPQNQSSQSDQSNQPNKTAE